jgi:cytochrome c2
MLRVLAVFLLALQFLAARSPKASIEGVVLRRTVSETSGRYAIAPLEAGTNQLKFSASGFEAFTEGPLSLTAGQKLTLDSMLKPANRAQNVSVVADNDRLGLR